MKRETPYTRLLAAVRQWRDRVLYPKQKTMWTYSKADIDKGDSWRLSDLYQRVAAANQMGWDVVLIATESGLTVQYHERPGDIDYFIL